MRFFRFRFYVSSLETAVFELFMFALREFNLFCALYVGVCFVIVNFLDSLWVAFNKHHFGIRHGFH